MYEKPIQLEKDQISKLDGWYDATGKYNFLDIINPVPLFNSTMIAVKQRDGLVGRRGTFQF